MMGHPGLSTNKAIQQYGEQTQAQASEASPHTMIAMLFAGAIESLNVMLGAMEVGQAGVQAKAASKAIAIVNGMRDLLDMKSSSELAENLYSMYSFIAKDLFRASFENDKQAIIEAREMLKDVQESWNKMPQAGAEGKRSASALAEAPTVAPTDTGGGLKKPALGLRKSAFYS